MSVLSKAYIRQLAETMTAEQIATRYGLDIETVKEALAPEDQPA